ncbi:MAG: hypothetical protein ABW318_20525 [Vicinamibacterales bacterium]
MSPCSPTEKVADILGPYLRDDLLAGERLKSPKIAGRELIQRGKLRELAALVERKT